MTKREAIEAAAAGLHVSWTNYVYSDERYTGVILSIGRKHAKLKESGPTPWPIHYVPFKSLTVIEPIQSRAGGLSGVEELTKR